MVEPLVLEATRAESVASLSIAGVDSRYYSRRLDALAASLEEEEQQQQQAPHHDEEEELSAHDGTSEPPPKQPHTHTLDLSALPSLESSEAECDLHSEKEPPNTLAELQLQQQHLTQQQTEPPDYGPPKQTIEFVMGDHVYQWCFFGPFPYQHHAIVMEVWREEGGDDAPQRLRVADFSNWRPKEGENGSNHHIGPTSALGRSFARDPVPAGSEHATYQGVIRTYECDSKDWHKVEYEVGFWKRHFSWSGTCTAAASDPPAMVRARVQFLVDHPEMIPCYNSIQSNCECVALWCKTGRWCTLQAASWLSTTAAGQVKSAVTLAGAATATQVPVSVTVPASGIWGWMGYTTTATTQMSLAAAQPLLLPAIAAFGVITVGVPAISLALAHRHWNKMTAKLHEAFWQAAIDQPDLFVECITHWSTQLE